MALIIELALFAALRIGDEAWASHPQLRLSRVGGLHFWEALRPVDTEHYCPSPVEDAA